MSKVLEIDDDGFEAGILRSQTLVLADFSATWCAPCKKLDPIVHELAVEYDGRLDVAHVDIEKAPKATARLGVLSVPTIIFFRGGEPVSRLTGLVPKETLRQHVDRLLG